MRKLFSIFTFILVLVLGIGIMKNSLSLMLYQYDSELFIELFCENTNQPELDCNGACQLEKIKTEEKNSQVAKVLDQIQSESKICVAPITITYYQLEFLEHTSIYPSLEASNYSFLFYNLIIQPPRF